MDVKTHEVFSEPHESIEVYTKSGISKDGPWCVVVMPEMETQSLVLMPNDAIALANRIMIAAHEAMARQEAG